MSRRTWRILVERRPGAPRPRRLIWKHITLVYTEKCYLQPTGVYTSCIKTRARILQVVVTPSTQGVGGDNLITFFLSNTCFCFYSKKANLYKRLCLYTRLALYQCYKNVSFRFSSCYHVYIMRAIGIMVDSKYY